MTMNELENMDTVSDIEAALVLPSEPDDIGTTARIIWAAAGVVPVLGVGIDGMTAAGEPGNTMNAHHPNGGRQLSVWEPPDRCVVPAERDQPRAKSVF
jgi:hypothetical protein